LFSIKGDGVANFSGNVTTGGVFTSNGGAISINGGGSIAGYFYGSGSSYTQGALVISSGTDNSPEARGQGVFMFNEGKDSTWYMGTRYNNADEWQVGRVAGTSLDTAAATTNQSVFKIDNTGSATFSTGLVTISKSNSGTEGGSLLLRNASGGSGAFNRIYFAPTASDYTTRSAIIQGENVDGNNNMALVFKTSAGADPVERFRIDQHGDTFVQGSGFFVGNSNTSGVTELVLTNKDTSLVDTNEIQNRFKMRGLYYDQSSSLIVETQIVSIHESSNGNGNSALGFLTQSGGSSPTEKVRITSEGGFWVGTDTRLNTDNVILNAVQAGDWALNVTHSTTTASNNYGILIDYAGSSPNGSGNNFIQARDNNSNRFVVSSNGNVTNINNSYGAISDVKLKENITDATPKLDDLMQVKIRNYNLIGEETKQLGVIAQELEEVFPSMVSESIDFEEQEVTDDEGNVTIEKVDLGTTTKSVKYSVFVPMLIKAIQELKAEIEQLKRK
jgi:hypothetical protein